MTKEPPKLAMVSDEFDGPPTPPPDASPQSRDDGPPPPDRPRDPLPGEIWADCPVTALGVHGDSYFYLDVLGQLAVVANHTKDRMRGVFGGRIDQLQANFPQFNKSGNVSGWSQEHTATAMVRACTQKGVWNAFDRVRGQGAWIDADGGVVLHCGDGVLYQGQWRATGEIDGIVYPSDVRLPRPLGPADFSGDPGAELMELLTTWNWSRGDLDAYLLLGWIMVARFGGALKWRPLAWITGDAGTGKSTLHDVIKYVIGEDGMLQATDTTEAGLRQLIGQKSVPVALDEVEAETDPRKAQSVVKLGRQAASGAMSFRGGADHHGQAFRVMSAFLLSSILRPAMPDQDLSRIAMLDLWPLAKGVPPPNLDRRRLGKVGRAMFGRVIAQWARLDDTLHLYRQSLSAAGHDARGCDQFGTLLALADLAMHDARPDEARCGFWAGKLSALVIQAQADRSSDTTRMFNYLMAQPLDVTRSGRKYSVGRWVLAACGLNPNDDPEPVLAREILPAFGLKIHGRGATAQLAIANSHAGLATLFRDTHWHAAGGMNGVWSQAAIRAAHAKSRGGQKFDGVQSRAILVPLQSIPGLFGDDDDVPEPQAQAPHEPDYNPDDFA